MSAAPAAKPLQVLPWGLAALAGAGLGLVQAVQIATPLFPRTPQPWALLAVVASRWVPLFIVLCAVLLWLLRARDGPQPLQRRLPWVIGLAVLAAMLADPLCWLLARTTHQALGLRDRPFWTGRDAPTLLGMLWSLSVPAAAVLAAMSVVIDRHVDGARRGAQALAATQLRLARVQRRALDAQLRNVQARVEPDFLFGTLDLIGSRFESAPTQGQGVLDALIRYLRAALPPSESAAATVGQQADLLRAYLEIETERAQGDLRTSVVVAASLQALPMAPLIVPPLVAWAVARAAGGAGAIDVRFDPRPDAIEVTIAVDMAAEMPGSDPPAVMAQMAQRLHALYGVRAVLTLAAAAPGGNVVRLLVPLPGP